MYLTKLRNAALETPSLLTIGTGILLVSYQQFIGSLPLIPQYAGCLLLLLASGIPHGALDHLVEQERSSRSLKPFYLGRFLLNYILLMTAYGVLWWYAPLLSLAVFLLISAWHFGETDLNTAPPTPGWTLARFVAGGWVLALILLTHHAETTPILARIVQHHSGVMQAWAAGGSLATTWLVGGAGLLGTLVVVAYRSTPARLDGWRMVRLGIILAITCWLPLLPAFILYFCGWHALNSFGTLQTYLHLPTRTVQSARLVWVKALPLTLLAFLFMSVSTLLWMNYIPDVDPIPSLFILLSTITLPHVQVMANVPSQHN